MVFIIAVYRIDLGNHSNQSNLLYHCMHLSLYMQLLWPLGFPLRVIVSIPLQSARAVALVIVDMLIAADISGMPVFATFLTWWFQEPAVIFYVSITLTVSAVSASRSSHMNWKITRLDQTITNHNWTFGLVCLVWWQSMVMVQ
jgi:hypothetical protein